MSQSITIKEQLSAAMKEAMRAKEKERLTVIRMLQAAIKQVEIDTRVELTADADLIALLDKQVKQRREAIAKYQEANRQELADKEQFEITVIQSFLPPPLTDAEIADLIAAAIQNTKAASMKDMGLVMSELKPKLQGRADMSAVSRVLKEKLTS